MMLIEPFHCVYEPSLSVLPRCVSRHSQSSSCAARSNLDFDIAFRRKSRIRFDRIKPEETLIGDTLALYELGISMIEAQKQADSIP